MESNAGAIETWELDDHPNTHLIEVGDVIRDKVNKQVGRVISIVELPISRGRKLLIRPLVEVPMDLDKLT